jgi:hypothetical protein
MRIASASVGLLVGVSIAVGLALSQAETKWQSGSSLRVVPTVAKGRMHETPIVRHCFWIGVPAGLVGAGVGYLLAGGANIGGALLGALLFGAMASSWREHWPDRFGRAGENAKIADSVLNGMVGALLGAAASAHLRKHHESLPARLPPPESEDA